MRKAVFCFTLLLCSVRIVSATTYSAAGTYSVPANCGFTVDGTADGWIRMCLTNDSGSCRDLWVHAGQSYPLRAASLELASSGSRPSSVTFDTGQTCGYTRSQGLDECNSPGYDEGYVSLYGGISSNIGFFAAEAGQIQVRYRSEGTTGPWHTLTATAGEFFLADVVDCQLVDGSDLTYLTAVAP